MSKLEQYILIFLGFFIFEIIFIRIGFFLGSPINKYTLFLSLISYFASLTFLYSSAIFPFGQTPKKYVPIILFFFTILCLTALTLGISKTYDTSWDGQGYHQSAVIALSNYWNPVFEPSINFPQYLPSQIFAEGYPSALWEMEASIYSVNEIINSAKILNIAIAIIAGLTAYSLLRKLQFGKFLSILISFLMTMQPVYIIQVLTFMEDGFGYELLVIASASLAILAYSSKSYWSIATFLMAELLLVTTKYSHLPASLVLGLLFVLIITNRYLNREYLFNKMTKACLFIFLLVSLIFATLPYIRNQVHHKSMFYPTNIPDLMGSVRYNNVPNNLQDFDKARLLFYGIFSRAQSKESGDPRSKSNIAELKLPFTFTMDEISDSAELYNNRVGGGGPLFSGIALLAISLVVFLYFKTENIQQRYAIYVSLFALSLILILSLLPPTPNLLRYTNQLQLIPFAIIIPIYSVFKRRYVKVFCYIIIALSSLNIFLFSSAIVNKTISETNRINEQMSQMRNSNQEYQVRAQQFYSSYILLNEQNIPFTAVDSLKCSHIQSLVSSSTTTQYCFK